jgi:hypothetical protein
MAVENIALSRPYPIKGDIPLLGGDVAKMRHALENLMLAQLE